MTVIVGLDTAADRWHARVRFVGGYRDMPSRSVWHQTPPTTRKANAAYKDPDYRRSELVQMFNRFCYTLPVDTHIFCEEPLALQNGKTTRLLSLSAGALWATGTQTVDKWHWVDVAHWKRVICGNGNINKEGIRDWVLGERLLTPEEIEVAETEVDLFDSECLVQYGLLALTEPEKVAKLKK